MFKYYESAPEIIQLRMGYPKLTDDGGRELWEKSSVM
jgi:hypothetical protein